MFFPDAAHTTAVISITVMRRKAFQTRVRLQIAGKLSHMLQVSPNTGSQAAKAMQGANGVKAKQKSVDLPCLEVLCLICGHQRALLCMPGTQSCQLRAQADHDELLAGSYTQNIM